MFGWPSGVQRRFSEVRYLTWPERGNQSNDVSEERRDKLSCRLSSRSKSNRRLEAAAFRKLRITTRQPTTTTSTTRMSPSLIAIDVGEERCHTFLRWGDYTQFVTLQAMPDWVGAYVLALFNI